MSLLALSPSRSSPSYNCTEIPASWSQPGNLYCALSTCKLAWATLPVTLVLVWHNIGYALKELESWGARFCLLITLCILVCKLDDGAGMQALFLRFSKHTNDMVYDVNCAPGDPGAALLLYEGRVIGMHQEGINNLIGEFDPTRPMHARLDDLTESALAAARSVGQDGLTLLAKCFSQAG